MYRNVEARYMKPDQRRTSTPPPTFSPQRQYPVSKQWGSTPPRYDQPKEVPAPKAPLDTSSPLQHWQQSGEHESLTKRLGFGGVPAKVFDDARDKADPGMDSPRRRVEERREKERQQHSRPWQSTGARGGKHTFDDMLPEYYAVHAELAPPAPGESKASAARKAYSSVGEYIRSGSPIRHSRGTTEPKERVHRYRSPVPFRSPGVKETDFDAHRRQTAKRGDFAREEVRVLETRQALKGRQVGRSFVPRVAKMAPSYQLDHVPDARGESSSPQPGTPRGRSTSRQ